MAKRATGVNKSRKTHSHKTAKRLAAKKLMLLEKHARHPKHSRPINPELLKNRV